MWKLWNFCIRWSKIGNIIIEIVGKQPLGRKKWLLLIHLRLRYFFLLRLKMLSSEIDFWYKNLIFYRESVRTLLRWVEEMRVTKNLLFKNIKPIDFFVRFTKYIVFFIGVFPWSLWSAGHSKQIYKNEREHFHANICFWINYIH